MSQEPTYIFKMWDEAESVEKVAAMTDAGEGHAHLIVLAKGADAVEKGITSTTDGHAHPWERGADGLIYIGESNGHTHNAATVSKAEGDDWGEAEQGLPAEQASTGDEEGMIMPENTQEQLEERLAATEYMVERLSAERDLSDTEKAYYYTLDEVDQDEFLEKSADERVADLVAFDAAEGGDVVIYKAADGTQYTLGDDPRMVEMAKRLDDKDAELADMRTNAELVMLHKRAEEELPHLPGSVAERAELLKAIDGMPEHLRDKALEAVKAGDTAMSKMFTAMGVQDGRTESSAEVQLQTLAKSYQEKHPDLTPEQAYSAVLDTPEGGKLFMETGPAR